MRYGGWVALLCVGLLSGCLSGGGESQAVGVGEGANWAAAFAAAHAVEAASSVCLLRFSTLESKEVGDTIVGSLGMVQQGSVGPVDDGLSRRWLYEFLVGQPDGNSERHFVMEDGKAVFMEIERALSGNPTCLPEDYALFAAPSARDAIAQFKNYHPELVFADPDHMDVSFTGSSYFLTWTKEGKVSAVQVEARTGQLKGCWSESCP